MAPRALGALFALLAALAFATALAGGLVPKIIPGWWDGHPTVNNQVIERKDVHVGLLAAYGCNLGEQVVCAEVHTKDDRIPVGYAELGLLGLIIVTTFALARSAWKIGDYRKFLGKFVLVEVALVAGGGVALFLVGPQIIVDDHPEIHVIVPIGIGMMVFWGAVAAAGVASVIALRLEPEPLRLKRSEPKLHGQLQQTQDAFDIHRMLAETHEPMRPSAPRYNHVSPGGALPGPAGPIVPQQPLFDAAPQLRPLYDLENAGVVPAPAAPPMPSHLTPMPRAAVGQIMGIPTPPPLEVVTPPQPMHAQVPNSTGPHQPMLQSTGPQQAMPPNGPTPPPPIALQPTAPQQAMPPQQTTPPPPSKPMPALPGIPPRTAPMTPVPRSIPPPAARGKPSVPPPVRGMQPPKHPTISHAIPPPPNATNLPPPSVLPARDSAVRIDGEPITAVEIDAEAKAKAAAMLKMTPAPALGDSTDKNMMPPVPVERTDESATVPPPPPADAASEPAIDRPSDQSLTVPRERQSFDAMETIARPKEAPEDLQATVERNPKLERPASKPAEVPISTAPASLPPPKKTTVTMTGPTPACPQCEAPMAWVEEHLRFYCAQCRMYF